MYFIQTGVNGMSGKILKDVERKEMSPKREEATEELCTFFKGITSDKIIVFDTETNGKIEKNRPLPSVLSLSAIKIRLLSKDDYQIERLYSRYYFPVEEFNPEAIAVNGLNSDVLTQKREEVKSREYINACPIYYKDDVDSFVKFCEGTDNFIAHNPEFDCTFVKGIDWSTKRVFDTMKPNSNIVCAEWNEWKQDWKWPRLREAAEYYKINTDRTEYHDSNYDVEVTINIFMEMLRRSEIRLKKF